MLSNAPRAAAVYGVELGKNLFHVFGLEERGAVVQRVKFRRDTVLTFFARAPPTLVGMEACPASQWLAQASGSGGTASGSFRRSSSSRS